MSATDERVAQIRTFTVPGRPVEVAVVRQYAGVAADWERLRLRARRNPVSVIADEERFAGLSATLRRLSAELGLKTCSTSTAGTDGVAGITGQQGMLPNDPGYLLSDTWFQSTERWCG
jgi:hypothetical protein